MAASCAAPKSSDSIRDRWNRQPAGLRRRARLQFLRRTPQSVVGTPGRCASACVGAPWGSVTTPRPTGCSRSWSCRASTISRCSRGSTNMCGPATYLEVGVSRGESLQLVRPETLALGHRPGTAPQLRACAQSECLRADQATAFFARSEPSRRCSGGKAARDGLHRWHAPLRVRTARFSQHRAAVYAGLAGLRSRLLSHRCPKRRA